MATLDLDTLIGEAVGVANNYAAIAGQVTGITDELRGMSEDKARLSKQASQAAATVIQADLEAKGQQEATMKSIAARLGTDSSKQGWIIGQAADARKVAEVNLADARNRVHAKQSVNFIDNPLGWIAARATINSDIADYNKAADEIDFADATATAAYTKTTQAFQNAQSLSSTITQSYIDASKILKSHEFNVQAQDATMQALRWNLEGIQLAANAGKDRLQTLFNARSAQMQEKQFANELERLRMQKESHSLALEAKKEKSDEDSLILKYIDKGHFNLTGRRLEGARAKDALILFKSKQPDVMEFFNSGMQSYQISPNGEKSVISLSPFDASSLIATNKVHNLPPAQTQVGDKLVEWRRNFESQAVQTQLQLDKKDKSSVERAFNKYVEDRRKQELGNVPNGSIFAPADPVQVAKVNKTIANLPVWANVLEPASKTGVDLSDPNITFGIVMSAVAEGKLSYVDAVDISYVYAAGLDLNNQSRNFVAMGLGPVSTYNTGVSIPGQIGKTNINLVDQTAIARALNKAEATRVSTRAMGQGVGRGYIPGETK